jgi:hypothetical protein
LIRAALVAAACAAAGACARMEPPPGGPPDVAPPQLLATRPDSFARLPDFKGEVEFRFDEVVSEGGTPSQGTGTGDLEKLIILSPTTRVPKVTWRRSRITVRPAEGWRPNRVYRVELLPGVADLRRNLSKRGTVLTFTTGAELPQTTITGTVVDWSTGRPAAAALVEALLLPDSLPYRALTDSSGRIALGPLPGGQYIVRGVLDQNRNNSPDPREAFDTVRLAAGKTNAGELWAFVHDTTPPRIREITVADSLGATVALSQTLDPRQRLSLSAATVRLLPDSTAVPVTSLLPKPVDDSLHRPAAPRDTSGRDSTRADTAARDSARRERPGIREVPRVERPAAPRAPRAGGTDSSRTEPAALASRPPLTDQLVVRVARPWTPGAKYEVEIKGVRNTSGTTGDVRGAFSVPKREPADTGRARGVRGRSAQDTVQRPTADSLKRRQDSLGRTQPQRSR